MSSLIDWDTQDPDEGKDSIVTMTDAEYQVWAKAVAERHLDAAEKHRCAHEPEEVERVHDEKYWDHLRDNLA